MMSETTLSGTSWLSMAPAAKCRMMWSPASGRPARAAANLNARSAFRGSQAGIVDHAVVEDSVGSTALRLAAAEAAKAGPTLATTRPVYRPVLHLLTDRSDPQS